MWGIQAVSLQDVSWLFTLLSPPNCGQLIQLVHIWFVNNLPENRAGGYLSITHWLACCDPWNPNLVHEFRPFSSFNNVFYIFSIIFLLETLLMWLFLKYIWFNFIYLCNSFIINSLWSLGFNLIILFLLFHLFRFIFCVSVVIKVCFLPVSSPLASSHIKMFMFIFCDCWSFFMLFDGLFVSL